MNGFFWTVVVMLLVSHKIFFWLMQSVRKATKTWREHRTDRGWTACSAQPEKATSVRLHVLWTSAPLHHRRNERPRVLHLLRYSVQLRRGHSEHGEQQHHSPEREDHHQRGLCAWHTPRERACTHMHTGYTSSGNRKNVWKIKSTEFKSTLTCVCLKEA